MRLISISHQRSFMSNFISHENCNKRHSSLIINLSSFYIYIIIDILNYHLSRFQIKDRKVKVDQAVAALDIVAYCNLLTTLIQSGLQLQTRKIRWKKNLNMKKIIYIKTLNIYNSSSNSKDDDKHNKKKNIINFENETQKISFSSYI